MKIPANRTLPSPVVSVPAPALSASLSVRKLRTSGSVKGGQSPAMFSSATSSRKKGGSGFEPAEPTSPKVTCIGQVRVKKRNKKKMGLSRSKSRRATEGEVSFRGEDGGDRVCFRNQRWVHLHLGSICEAVKTLGSEINCFYLCGRQSQCSPGPGKRKGKRAPGVRTGSCGASFARWLMAVHESDEAEEDVARSRNSRREMEMVADELAEKVVAFGNLETGREHKEAAEVCVPPPNALLLMRCRSDPVRMAALESRFWGSPVSKPESEDEEEEEDEGEVETKTVEEPREDKKFGEVLKIKEEEEQKVVDIGIGSRMGKPEMEEEEEEEEEEQAVSSPPPPPPATTETTHVTKQTLKKKKKPRRHSFSMEKELRRCSSFSEKEIRRRFSFSSYAEPRRASLYVESSLRKPVTGQSGPEVKPATEGEEEEENNVKELPDCLLMMLYEPKLSMEVSKETWVCSADFVRPKPHRHRGNGERPIEDEVVPERMAAENCRDGEGDEENDEDKTPEPKPEPPSAPPETTKVGLYGSPFVLTRCKSDPVKASAKVSPEMCFWRSRHQPICAAAEIGF